MSIFWDGMERGRKPDVEVSPACPRCDSSDTKFCYYNNYSLTQPRYFCKACRRYWTKGGSLRNVPMGGGCRKSRRGKSTRVVSAGGGINSRTSTHGGIESSSSISAGTGASTSIDLATVYANFLGQTPRPDIHAEALPEQREGNNVIPSSIGFSDFHSPHINDLVMCSDLPPESGFLEFGSCPAVLSETQLLPGDGNAVCFGGFDAFDRKHQLTVGNNFNSIISDPISSMLPPLPEDMALPDGTLWPCSELMLPNQIVPPTDHGTAGPVEPGQTLETLNGNMSPLSALNPEAFFGS